MKMETRIKIVETYIGETLDRVVYIPQCKNGFWAFGRWRNLDMRGVYSVSSAEEVIVNFLRANAKRNLKIEYRKFPE